METKKESLFDLPSSFFKKTPLEVEIVQLLECVAHGKQNDAEAMVKKNSQLLLVKGDVTDYSNRTFQNITPFQLALWYFDWRMWKMINKYLPKEETEKQLQEHVYAETAYKKMHGDHYNFMQLINALKATIDIYSKVHYPDVPYERYIKCLRDLGQIQRMVPVHVANEYCNPNQTLSSTTPFDEEELERSLEVYDYDNGDLINWFPLPSDLGSKHTVFSRDDYKGAIFDTGNGRDKTGDKDMTINLMAISTLHKVRGDQFEQLKQELLNPTLKSTL